MESNLLQEAKDKLSAVRDQLEAAVKDNVGKMRGIDGDFYSLINRIVLKLLDDSSMVAIPSQLITVASALTELIAKIGKWQGVMDTDSLEPSPFAEAENAVRKVYFEVATNLDLIKEIRNESSSAISNGNQLAEQAKGVIAKLDERLIDVQKLESRGLTQAYSKQFQNSLKNYNRIVVLLVICLAIVGGVLIAMTVTGLGHLDSKNTETLVMAIVNRYLPAVGLIVIFGYLVSLLKTYLYLAAIHRHKLNVLATIESLKELFTGENQKDLLNTTLVQVFTPNVPDFTKKDSDLTMEQLVSLIKSAKPGG